jgi:hypothetical protein
MSTDIAVARCIAQAERRVRAMQVLCEMLVGQAKAESRQLAEIKSAIAATGEKPQSSSGAPGDSSLAMLEG